jgi:2-polyprenyl-6-hydroxyphenyl methylase/3-demethylubiquinone-9 3-methyltransferase
MSPAEWKDRFRRSPSGRLVYVSEKLPRSLEAVLDVGNVGGEASPHARLRELVEARGGRLYGVDADAEQARLARGPGQVVGSALELPFAAGSFDAVYMGEVIEHVWTPMVALREIHRVLKPGGTLVVDTPHVYAFGRLVSWVLRGTDSMGDPDHKLLLTPAALSNLLERSGFEVDDMCTDAKWAIASQSLPWVPWGRRLGSHLLATATRI